MTKQLPDEARAAFMIFLLLSGDIFLHRLVEILPPRPDGAEPHQEKCI
jgi:hypothetical protein